MNYPCIPIQSATVSRAIIAGYRNAIRMRDKAIQDVANNWDFLAQGRLKDITLLADELAPVEE